MTDLLVSGNYGEPLLRTRSSGQGGSGYRAIHVGDGKSNWPGVTTISGILDKPGIAQYEANEVALKAVTNIDALLNRTMDEGYEYLRHAGRNATSRAQKIGTNVHDFIACDLAGRPHPDILFPEVEQMVGAWEAWRWENDIEPVALEATLYNRDCEYGGTTDFIGRINGVPTLLDWKSGKDTYFDNRAQLAALGACDEMAVLDPEGGFEYVRSIPDGWDGATRSVRGEEKAVTRWRIEAVPPFSQYAFGHIRWADYDRKGYPHDPFLVIDVLTDAQVEAAWLRFQGCLLVKAADKLDKVATPKT